MCCPDNWWLFLCGPLHPINHSRLTTAAEETETQQTQRDRLVRSTLWVATEREAGTAAVTGEKNIAAS